MMYIKFFKPLFDFIIGSLIFTVTLPIFLIIIIVLLFLNMGRPFFIQDRPGKDEKIFKIIKFKTMNDGRDKVGNLLPDSERFTKIGRFIRNTSLDELPQMINVIKGDMSIVGPRPLLVDYLSLYSEEQKKRHIVKPGITGWAQVNGRNAISWEEKFSHDLYYVKSITFWFDMRIVFLTLKKILFSEGINSSSEITMEKFNGNN